MSVERRKLVEAVFTEAAAVPRGERLAVVEARCGADAEARAEVLSLLEHHAEEGEDRGFLDHAELTGVGGLGRMEADGPPLKPGTKVAGFTIGSVLGSGGMGMVYLAEQDRPHRTVALKLIRLGARGLLRRFEHEAEVLGRLQHPGIAQVYEAGRANLLAAGGEAAQPYIAMEFVKGPPLDEYVGRAGLDLRTKLELVAKVCDAVQHAHQRSVIHRDLKPANILVDEGSGEPKVLDFGVARATGADVRETMQTGAGQLIGTLAYMSPEQMLGDPAEVDTRTDVYALGVILYQLLTGRLPHRLDGTALPEAARIIREEEPARPGTVVRSLRGEVETIITKALAKDRARRYQSAADLGLDLRRYLEGRPIAAKDDSALYVLGKQLKRHRTLVGAGLGFVLMLAWFAVYASIQSSRNEKSAKSEERAKTEALDSLKAAKDARVVADQTSQRLALELATANTERGRLYARVGNLAGAEDLIWPAFLADPSSAQVHWALWDVYSRQPCLANFKAHEGPVRAVAFSRDGSVLYTGGDDNLVRVWDVASGACTATLEGHTGAVQELTISAGGGRMASAALDGMVIIWDLATGKAISTIKGVRGGARSVSFSPDGERVVVGSGEGNVRLFDAATGRAGRLLHRHNGQVQQVRWSPGGDVIASCAGGTKEAVVLWDLNSNTGSALEGQDWTISGLAFSPDGSTLAGSGLEHQIGLWSIPGGRSIRSLPTPSPLARGLEFSADGATLIAGEWWSTDVWDVATGKVRRSLSVRDAAFSNTLSRDGGRVASGFGDGWVRLWDLGENGSLRRLAGHRRRVEGAVSPDGTLAATGDADGAARLWDTASGEVLARWDAHGEAIRFLRFSPDGATLMTGAENGSLRLWDLRTGLAAAELRVATLGSAMGAAFLPDGRRLACAPPGGSVRVLSLPDLAVLAERPAGEQDIVAIKPSPDGATLMLRTRDQHLLVWRPDGRTGAEPPADLQCWDADFSADGKIIARVGQSSGITLWDAATWRQVDSLGGAGTTLSGAVRFHPTDPRFLFWANTDGVVTMFDIVAKRELLRLEDAEPWQAMTLSLSQDGRVVGAFGGGRVALLWDLAHFDRHIAGNVDYQIARQAPKPGGEQGPRAARAWGAAALATAPARGIIERAQIAAWARAGLDDARAPGAR